MKLILVALMSVGLLGINAAPLAQAAEKDNEDSPPGWKKSGKVPPGLAKKGGVPPGQAKKHGNTPETEEADTAPPAAKPVTPTSVPAPAPAPDPPKAPEVKTTGDVPAPAPAAKPAESAKAPPAAPKTAREKREALDQRVKTLNTLGSNPTERAAVLQQTSKALGVPMTTLQNQQKNHPELRPGGLYMANAIAKKTKKPAGEIIKRHLNDGKSWGEIARENNLNLDRLLEDSANLEKAVRG